MSTTTNPSQSTGSSSSGSTSGPNRFRGDVPSFNPSSKVHQQHFTPANAAAASFYPHPQLQPNGAPFMYGNFMYSMYPQYDYGGYPQYQYYMPNPGYSHPQYIPMNGAPAMYNPNVNRSKGKYKNNNGNNKNSRYQVPQQPYMPQPFPMPYPMDQPLSPHHLQQELSPSQMSGYASQTGETSAIASPQISHKEPSTPPTTSTRDSETVKDDTVLQAPLFFNTSTEEFSKFESMIAESRKQHTDEKQIRLTQFIQSQADHDILINTLARTKIIDLNSNAEFTKLIPSVLNNKPNDLFDNINNKSNDSTTNEKLTGSNWASVLQLSSSKKINKPKSVPSTPSAPTPSVITPSNESITIRTIEQDSSQPLGLLILKVLYDPLYKSMKSLPAFRIKARGLTNTGNICYMNAILQVLLFCEPLNKILRLIEDKAVENLSKESPTPLLDLTLKFYKDFLAPDVTYKGNLKALSPEDFYMNLITNEKFQHLKWGQQEDAEEFLGYLLDGLHEEFVKSIKTLSTSQVDGFIQEYQAEMEDSAEFNEFKLRVKNAIKIIKKSADTEEEKEEGENGWSEVGANSKKVSAKRTVEIEPSPISTIFGGQFRSVLTIPKGKESQSITLDPFRCIQLDISDADINTIEDAFIKFNEPEKLPYKSSSNKEVIAKKQTFIDQLPNVLLIHLKRFSYQLENKHEELENEDKEPSEKPVAFNALGGIEKLRKKIKYLHFLSIPQECLSKQLAATKINYKLTGVIYHHGTSAEGGHYTCDVLRKSSVYDSDEESSGKANDNEWIRIDDTSVDYIDKNDVIDGEEATKTAYILLYQKL